MGQLTSVDLFNIGTDSAWGNPTAQRNIAITGDFKVTSRVEPSGATIYMSRALHATRQATAHHGIDSAPGQAGMIHEYTDVWVDLLTASVTGDRVGIQRVGGTITFILNDVVQHTYPGSYTGDMYLHAWAYGNNPARAIHDIRLDGAVVNDWTDLQGAWTKTENYSSELDFHRVSGIPAGPTYDPSAVYMVNEYPGLTYKAFRVFITDNNGWVTVQTAEVKFNGASGSGAAFASTFYDGGTIPAYAFDDNTGTRWASGLNQYVNSFIGQIFATPQTVTSLSIQMFGLNPDTTPKDFKLQGSDDTTNGADGTWVDLGSWTGVDDWTVTDELKTFQFLDGEGEAEFFFSNSDGSEIRSVITHGGVDAKIDAAITAYSTMFTVADITARDALTMTENGLVLVADASADATVTSGTALYFWDDTGQAWTKMYEFEGMDIVFSWANLADTPTSSVAAIDQAVTDSHTHANAAVLDSVSENANTRLEYNSVSLNGHKKLKDEEW